MHHISPGYGYLWLTDSSWINFSVAYGLNNPEILNEMRKVLYSPRNSIQFSPGGSVQTSSVSAVSDLTGKQRNGPYVGLRNLGATCYMNAVLQYLFMNTKFRNHIFRFAEKNTDNGGRKTPSVLQELKRLFYGLQFGDCSAYDARGLAEVLKIQPNFQEDALEFASTLLASLESEIREYAGSSNFIRDIFEGETQQTITCNICGSISSKSESFYELSINISDDQQTSSSGDQASSETNPTGTSSESPVSRLRPRRYLSTQKEDRCSFLASFQNLFRKELLSGENLYFCDRCESKVTAEKKIRLSKLPPFLHICIQRYDYDHSAGTRKKLSHVVEIPFAMSVKNQYSETPDIKDYTNYELFGVLEHLGTSAHSGHYVAIIKDYNYRDSEESLTEDRMLYDPECSRPSQEDSDKQTVSDQEEFTLPRRRQTKKSVKRRATRKPKAKVKPKSKEIEKVQTESIEDSEEKALQVSENIDCEEKEEIACKEEESDLSEMRDTTTNAPSTHTEMTLEKIEESADEIGDEMEDRMTEEKTDENADEIGNDIVDEDVGSNFEARLEKLIHQKIEAFMDQKIDIHIDEKIDARLEAKIDAMIDEKIEGKFELHAPVPDSKNISMTFKNISTDKNYEANRAVNSMNSFKNYMHLRRSKRKMSDSNEFESEAVHRNLKETKIVENEKGLPGGQKLAGEVKTRRSSKEDAHYCFLRWPWVRFDDDFVVSWTPPRYQSDNFNDNVEGPDIPKMDSTNAYLVIFKKKDISSETPMSLRCVKEHNQMKIDSLGVTQSTTRSRNGANRSETSSYSASETLEIEMHFEEIYDATEAINRHMDTNYLLRAITEFGAGEIVDQKQLYEKLLDHAIRHPLCHLSPESVGSYTTEEQKNEIKCCSWKQHFLRISLQTDNSISQHVYTLARRTSLRSTSKLNECQPFKCTHKNSKEKVNPICCSILNCFSYYHEDLLCDIFRVKRRPSLWNSACEICARSLTDFLRMWDILLLLSQCIQKVKVKNELEDFVKVSQDFVWDLERALRKEIDVQMDPLVTVKMSVTHALLQEPSPLVSLFEKGEEIYESTQKGSVEIPLSKWKSMDCVLKVLVLLSKEVFSFREVALLRKLHEHFLLANPQILTH
eukprot:GHVP01055080.1.p1 GENE.GHVP01055080.1~~GHVP01055080.1.p1  ORF type:complete len:1131 (-),score=209.36 GHVP01055080.1:1112-4474(-)